MADRGLRGVPDVLEALQGLNEVIDGILKVCLSVGEAVERVNRTLMEAV